MIRMIAILLWGVAVLAAVRGTPKMRLLAIAGAFLGSAVLLFSECNRIRT
jgi:hypothetical protein